MKKFWVCMAILMIPTLVYAGAIETIVPFNGSNVRRINISWVEDGLTGTGAVATLALTPINGRIIKIVADPGATAPTDNYDIQLLDSDGIDILNAAATNLHTSTTQQRYPVAIGRNGGSDATDFFVPIEHYGPVTFSLYGQANDNALGNFSIYVEPK